MPELTCAMGRLLVQNGYVPMGHCDICGMSARRLSGLSNLNSKKSSPRTDCDSRYERTFRFTGQGFGFARSDSTIARAGFASDRNRRIPLWNRDFEAARSV